MNPKPIIFSGILAMALAMAHQASSQIAPRADQGISTHNYKHLNKAALAGKAGLDGTVIPVSGATAIDHFGIRSNVRRASQTPRYATETFSFVVQTIRPKQKVNINPLISNRNYKTINPAPAKPKQEEWVSLNI